MLSYRHAFHAGNHADVLKHALLVACLRHLCQKPGPVHYLDSHAGAGLYALDSDMANKTGEWRSGIGLLWDAESLPPLLADYRTAVLACNGPGALRRYPGSPWLAGHCLREQDRLVCCELHSSDYPLLANNLGRDRRVRVLHADGFQDSLARVPPASKRGLVIIDPSYEVKSDYQTVVQQLQALHRRFATGVYLLWYPVVDAERIARLESDLKASGIRRVQQFELGPNADHRQPGLTGSGMIVINPPWTLMAAAQQALPWLAERLGPAAYWKAAELVGE